MSVSVPTAFNRGDVETMEGLREKYTFCDAAMATAIQCRVIGTNTISDKAGQRTTCNLATGLLCNNAWQRNGEICYDYEIRYTCNCGELSDFNNPMLQTCEFWGSRTSACI